MILLKSLFLDHQALRFKFSADPRLYVWSFLSRVSCSSVAFLRSYSPMSQSKAVWVSVNSSDMSHSANSFGDDVASRSAWRILSRPDLTPR
jgi:hypothetical protein